MSEKNRFDIVPVILSIIGLIADCITIIIFYSNLNLANQTTKINDLSIVIILFVMTYSWFTISWFIAKNSFRKLKAIKNHEILTKTTFGVGFIVLPLSIGLSYLRSSGDYIWLHILIWIIIYSASRLLMPVFYPEFAKYMKRTNLIQDYTGENSMDYIGKWKCSLTYKSLSSKESFSIGDFIVVYEQQYNSKDGFTDLFYYNSSNNGKGLIHYSELDTYWETESNSEIAENQ